MYDVILYFFKEIFQYHIKKTNGVIIKHLAQTFFFLLIGITFNNKIKQIKNHRSKNILRKLQQRKNKKKKNLIIPNLCAARSKPEQATKQDVRKYDN